MDIFKKCPMCNKIWHICEDFLLDHSLELIGYQANLTSLSNGFYIFCHKQEDCQTSISIPVFKLEHLRKGNKYNEIKTGSPECEGKCLTINNLEECKAECEGAYARELMKTLINYKKTPNI